MPPLRSQYFFYTTLLILDIKLHRSYHVFAIWLRTIRNSSPYKWNPTVWILSNSSTDGKVYMTCTAIYRNVMKLLESAIKYTTVVVKLVNEPYDTYFYHSTDVYIFHCKYLYRNSHRFCSIWNIWSYLPRIKSFEEGEKPVIWWNKKFNGKSEEL